MRILFFLPLFIYSLAATAQTPGYMEWVDRSARYIEDNKLDSASVALQRAM